MAAPTRLALLASAAFHGGLALFVLELSSSTPPKPAARRIAIEVTAKPRSEPRPEPPPPPPPPAPAEPPPAPPPPRPKKPAPQPPPSPVPVPEPVEPPPEPPSVGLSAASIGAGSGGPAFAVGDTLHGATSERAPAPRPKAPSVPVASADPGRARDALPRRKRPNEPEYPRALERQGIEAEVMVSVKLDATGRVLAVRIIKPARDDEFNEAARRAALAEQFEPALRGGLPVPYTLSFTYHFRLEDQ